MPYAIVYLKYSIGKTSCTTRNVREDNPFAWLWLGQPFQWALSQRKGALVKNSALTGEQGANWDTDPFLFPLFVSVVDNRAQPYKS
jgi:hypothetical protein